jgi:putative ABC transport system permease protein
MAESLLLATIGGAGGAVLGTLITAGFCADRGWPVVIPAWVTPSGLLLTLVIGALAGVYPALRASRLPPTEALNQI